MKYVIAVLAILALALIAIVTIGHSSNNSGSKPTPNQPAVVNLLDHDNDTSSVTMTIQGSIVGEDQYQAIRITVDQHTRTVDVLSGYENEVVKTESFTNTPAAYSVFLRALNLDDYAAKAKKGAPSDERGYCAEGNRYTYEVAENGTDIQRLWNDSCSSSEGSFNGVGPSVRLLFQRQITGYDDYIIGTNVTD